MHNNGNDRRMRAVEGKVAKLESELHALKRENQRQRFSRHANKPLTDSSDGDTITGDGTESSDSN